MRERWFGCGLPLVVVGPLLRLLETWSGETLWTKTRGGGTAFPHTLITDSTRSLVLTLVYTCAYNKWSCAYRLWIRRSCIVVCNVHRSGLFWRSSARAVLSHVRRAYGRTFQHWHGRLAVSTRRWGSVLYDDARHGLLLLPRPLLPDLSHAPHRHRR